MRYLLLLLLFALEACPTTAEPYVLRLELEAEHPNQLRCKQSGEAVESLHVRVLKMECVPATEIRNGDEASPKHPKADDESAAPGPVPDTLFQKDAQRGV